jgi:orotate phosphoribosyltransferase
MTDFAARTAGILLDIAAIHVWQGEKPFIFTSGWASPVYIDCRKLIGFLPERRAVTDMAAKELARKIDMSTIDVIAGGETAGISYAAWISEALNKPMVYVRKKPKDFGRGKQIEGYMKDGARVLLVEDLATDGASKVTFADALRAAGASIDHAFSVFYYDIYAESKAVLSEGRLSLHALCTWRDVIAVARDKKIWDSATLTAVEDFLADPAGWSVRYGGAASRKAAQA